MQTLKKFFFKYKISIKKRPKGKPFTSVRKIFHCKLTIPIPLFHIKLIYVLYHSFIVVYPFFMCLTGGHIVPIYTKMAVEVVESVASCYIKRKNKLIVFNLEVLLTA